jgi:hypothetical protein
VKALKKRNELVIMPDDESDEAFLEDTLGLSHKTPAVEATVDCAPNPTSPTGERTGKVWSLTIHSIKKESR